MNQDYIEALRSEVRNAKEEYWRALQSDASQSYINKVMERLNQANRQLNEALPRPE